MKLKNLMGLLLCLGALPVMGQNSEVDALRKQLQQVTESFEKSLKEHREIIDSLKQKLDALQKQQGTLSTNQQALQTMIEKSPADIASPGVVPPKSWRPTDPIRIGRAGAFMDIGLIGTFAAGTSTARDIEGGLQLGGHDPNQRGFTVQGVEAIFTGVVDPYFRANANILFSIDSGGETFLELEEAWLETLSLPGNLQLRGGQFLTEFGRHNTLHPHSWAFVDAPLVAARLLGPDGLRNPGARVAWLMPTPFYSELFLSIQNSHGETASSFRSSGHSHGEEEETEIPFAFRHPDNDRGVRHLRDLLFSPRYALSFNLTDSQTVLFGASGAFGPNSSGGSGDNHTQIYGLDFYWKWKPVNHSGGFPFVSWQTEALWRRYKAGAFDWDEDGDGALSDGELAVGGAPAFFGSETLSDYGLYTQLLYGFRKGWVAGLRFDYLGSKQADYEKVVKTLDGESFTRDPERGKRWRISPSLTWFPSEFSKVRLQYNYDDRRDFGVDHSVWLQFEFVLGAHGAHKF